MSFNLRNLSVWFAIAALIGATVWAISFRSEPRADFTFINNAEAKSIDPAIPTGQLEARILEGLYEGLTSWDPATLGPLPGVAQSWELSADKKVYTFHLRADAKWSDGSPCKAYDFLWSHRRTLDPQLASQYSYQLFYVVNAKKYFSSRVVAGDPVEVEMNDLPAGARLFARGELLKGKLISVTPPIPETPPADEKESPKRTYVVEIDGKRRTFAPGNDPKGYKQVLLDFDQVGCKAIDAQTYQMTLENPTPYFIGLTGMFPLYPVNPRCVETYGSPDWTKPENIVSNGPFRLASRKIRERTRLVKNEYYWDRDNVKLNSVDVLVVQSDTTGLNLYLTGKVDWINSVPPTIVTQLLANYPRDLQPTPAFILRFYRINTKVKPFDDPRVRQAINLAINKKEIVESVTRAGEPPARSLVPPIIKKYMPYEPALCGEYDPAKARRLLAEAGYPGGKGFPKIPLLYSTDETHQMTSELTQRQLKENLGIDFEPQNQEWNAFLSAQRTGTFSICNAGWIGDYLDPNTFLGMFTSDSDDNETGWGNADYDDLIRNKAPTEPDPQRRLARLHDAEAILMRDLPIIPLYVGLPKNMVRPYVHGFHGNVLDDHPLKWISIDAAARREFQQAEGLR